MYDCTYFSCLDWHMPGNTSSLGFYKTKSFTQERISEFTDSSFFFFFHIRKTVIEQLSASSQVRQVHPPWVHWEDQHVPGLLQVALAVGCRAAFSWGPIYPSFPRAKLGEELSCGKKHLSAIGSLFGHGTFYRRNFPWTLSPWRYKMVQRLNIYW